MITLYQCYWQTHCYLPKSFKFTTGEAILTELTSAIRLAVLSNNVERDNLKQCQSAITQLQFIRASLDVIKGLLFDFLFKMKNEIENTFGAPLEWMRLDDKKACRIQFSHKVDGYNKEEWPQYTQWHLEYMSKFERAFKTPLKKAANALKQNSKNMV